MKRLRALAPLVGNLAETLPTIRNRHLLLSAMLDASFRRLDGGFLISAPAASGRAQSRIPDLHRLRRLLHSTPRMRSGLAGRTPMETNKMEVVKKGNGRLAAWRNMMLSAINAGLEQGLFGLGEDENLWPGYDKEACQRVVSHFIYRFSFLDLPAIACVSDAGWGELSIHVAINPTAEAERWIICCNGDFLSGEAFASGWLERKNGKWLQQSAKPDVSIRRHILPIIAGAAVEPHGYKAKGMFML